MGLFLCLVALSEGRAQDLGPALPKALTVDAAYAALGIRTPPESTGFLLLDLPEVAVAGKIRATLASELPGTAWLVLLRGRAGRPPNTVVPGTAPTPVLLLAQPFKAGTKASASVEFELERSQNFTLLAFARGRWFAVERQVKVGQPFDVAQAAKQARARDVAKIMALEAPAPIAGSASASASGQDPR